MEKNRNSTQRIKLFYPGACTQLKEVPEGPFPLEEGEDFHLSLYDSLESDSDSLNQERQYQQELQHRIQENEEMVTQTLEDTEFDAENGDEEGWNLYDSLEEAEDEQDRDKIEPEHKDNDKIRHQSSDRYASLRYNPNWRNTRVGAEIFMYKQKHNSHLNDSLESLLQESNELLEKNIGRYHESSFVLQQKRQTNKAEGVRFSLRESDNNVEKQPKKKRLPSPYCKCEASSQEKRELLDSPGFYDEAIKSDLQNHRETRTDKIAEGVPQDNHGKNKCHNEDDCERFSDSECERLDLLEHKRQTNKAQGVRFSLKDSDNVEKQSKRKRLPSPYCKSEDSTQDCDSLDSPGFYADTIKSDLQNNRKTRTDKITETVPEDSHEKNKFNDEEDYENLNDHYQKEYQQFLEHESTCSDVSINSVKYHKDSVISREGKLQPKVRSQDNIVEHNKQTLGRRKIASYQLLYSEKEVKSAQQVSTAKSSKSTNTDESRQNTMDGRENYNIQMKWKQRAQRLQNQKAKQLSTKKKGLTNVVRERPPRPPEKPSTKQKMQIAQIREEQPQHFENVVHQNKNTSELLIIQRDDNSVLLSPSSDRTFTSSVNQTGPAFIPNSQPTVNLNINLNTLSSGGNTQTTVKLVPSHHPMSQTSSVHSNHNVYSTPQPQNFVPYFQEYQKNPESRTSRYPQQFNTDPSHFSPTLYIPENAQHQPLYDIQAPSYAHFGQAQCDQMVNPNHYQAAYTRTLAPGLYNHPHLQAPDISAGNSLFYSMNQEKMMKEDHNQFGKEYGNAGFPTLPFLSSHQQYLVHSPSTRLIRQMEHIYEDTPRLAHTHPGSRLVLPPIVPMADSDSELDQTRSNKKKAVTITRWNSDSYLAQMEKVNKLNEKNNHKPYTLRDYKDLKQDMKLGGLGPDYKSAQEKAKKIKRQKEYARQIKEQNLKVGSKSIPSLLKPPPSIENKAATSRRKLALEYARNIHKPKPLATKPGDVNEKPERGELTEHGQYAQLDPSHNILLKMMQKRHENEKQIVAAFKAMHVT
ncbi:jhy protein homolog isoform X2 [Heterodontus francisci]|uniref:jhy protein homolog isoform X2 n=1 Tax=Heterodontus francisci TaxID=7792 RepID=UPI00355BF122